MVFNGGLGNVILLSIFIIWAIVISVFLLRMITHYNRLTQGITKEGLKEILDTLLKRQDDLEEETRQLEVALKNLAVDGTYHIRKIGLVRFNPFSDTGGSQSFTLAILDSGDNGLVMTSLYARTGNRWYAKEVRGGKGKELELSKEEQAAIKRAQLVGR